MKLALFAIALTCVLVHCYAQAGCPKPMKPEKPCGDVGQKECEMDPDPDTHCATGSQCYPPDGKNHLSRAIP